MKVGIVSTWFERGAAYVSRAYANVLGKDNEVYIYARGGERLGKGQDRWDQSHVTWAHQIPGMPPSFIDFHDFQAWVNGRRLDAVIFNEQVSWDIIMRARDLPLLLGAYIDYYTAETVPFFWLYDFLLCNTHRHHSVFSAHPQAIYVPWGTDVEVYRCAQYGPVDKSVVTFFHSCGISAWRKGTDLVVDAFRTIKGPASLVIHAQTALEDCFRLWANGRGAAETRQIIQGDPRITLIEQEVGEPGLYHYGDVYVYPSRLDGIGLTLAEAGASGMPIITTNAPPMNEMVQHGANGRVVAVKCQERRQDGYYWPVSVPDRGSLVHAMQWYVENLSQLEQLKRTARQYAEEHLDWLRNAASLSLKLSGLKRRRDLATADLVQAVERYEQRSARFAWLPLSYEARLRTLGLDRVYSLTKAALKRSKR